MMRESWSSGMEAKEGFEMERAERVEGGRRGGVDFSSCEVEVGIVVGMVEVVGLKELIEFTEVPEFTEFTEFTGET